LREMSGRVDAKVKAGLFASLLCFQFSEQSARLVEGEGIRRSPDHEDNTGDDERHKQVKSLRDHILTAAYEQNHAYAFECKQPPSETQRAFAGPEKSYRSEREKDVRSDSEHATEKGHVRAPPCADHDAIPKKSTDPYRQTNQN